MSEDVEHELILPPISEKYNICLPLSVNAVAKYWNIDLPMTEANEIASKYAEYFLVYMMLYNMHQSYLAMMTMKKQSFIMFQNKNPPKKESKLV